MITRCLCFQVSANNVTLYQVFGLMISFLLLTFLFDDALNFQEVTYWSTFRGFSFNRIFWFMMYLLFNFRVRLFLRHQTVSFKFPPMDSRLSSMWSLSSISICSPTERDLFDFHYWSPGCCQGWNYLVLSFDSFPLRIITSVFTWSIFVMKILKNIMATYTGDVFASGCC